MRRELGRVVRPFVTRGDGLLPEAEFVAGFALFAVPIPEPTMETATDIAGLIMMGHAMHRIRGRQER
jgi:hypothetical protein